MFRSLMTIIRKRYLYLTKVIFMLKTLGKITLLYKLGDAAAHAIYVKTLYIFKFWYIYLLNYSSNFLYIKAGQLPNYFSKEYYSVHCALFIRTFTFCLGVH